MSSAGDESDSDEELNADDELDPKQLRAVVALLTERTIEQAAERVGVNERTLRRWLGQDPFRHALRAAQRATFEHAHARLQEAATLAVDTLKAVMEDANAPAAARVGAAKAALEQGSRSVELAQVIERVDAMERQLENGVALRPADRRQ